MENMNLYLDLLPFAVLLVLNIEAFKKCKKGFMNGSRHEVLKVVIGAFIVGLFYQIYTNSMKFGSITEIMDTLCRTVFVADVVWVFSVNFYELLLKFVFGFMKKLSDKYKPENKK